ncbi:MAG: KxYKxGKxW signal peptide domain-containing protein [Syntrophomonadaceae bacterium]
MVWKTHKDGKNWATICLMLRPLSG